MIPGVVSTPIHWQSSGQRARRPVYLLPGAACDRFVWHLLLPKLASNHRVHSVAYAGFCGRPPVDGPLLSQARSALEARIAGEPEPPIVIAHSMGAFLAYQIAATNPLHALVVVDGPPNLGPIAMPGLEPVARMAEARKRADSFRVSADFGGKIRDSCAKMVADPALAAELGARAARSHARVVAETMFTLWTTDLTGDIARISAPTLVLMSDPTPEPAAFRQQLSALPDHRVATIPASRHCIMLDKPDLFEKHLMRFLRSQSS